MGIIESETEMVIKYGVVCASFMQMIAYVGANQWISGEVKTLETYKYGKFITRMKGDDELGTVTSFFTFWKGDYPSEPWSYAGWSELDVELVPSESEGTFNTNIIWSYM